MRSSQMSIYLHPFICFALVITYPKIPVRCVYQSIFAHARDVCLLGGFHIHIIPYDQCGMGVQYYIMGYGCFRIGISDGDRDLSQIHLVARSLEQYSAPPDLFRPAILVGVVQIPSYYWRVEFPIALDSACWTYVGLVVFRSLFPG